ncbi:MAG: sulfatase [Mucilaginibacter polytrichastri]|nr:sulfatase [Mucilaginibacter polytrichastri]
MRFPFALFTIFFLAANNLFAQQQKSKPNILIILTDDHAFQAIGAYGAKYGVTPNIDRIAREGAVFNHAYVTNSICGPSRATILTGKYSHKNGFKTNADAFDVGQDMFTKHLKSAGFQTAWVGKWHLKNYPQGFDFWKIVPGQGQYYNPDFIDMKGDTSRMTGYCTDLITDIAFDFLDKRDQSKPFCLVVGEKAPHRNWMPDTGDLGRFDKVTFPSPHDFSDDYTGRIAAAHQDMSIEKTMLMDDDLKMEGRRSGLGGAYTARMNPEQKKKWMAHYSRINAELQQKHLSGKALTEWKYQHYMRDYLATTASLDRNVGRILGYLDKNNLSKNTIVIYLSDQGFYLGEHGWFDKRFMYEESYRTPLIMRYPGVIKPGTNFNQMVLNMDIGPTMLDIEGLPVPADVQGKSFFPVLKNPKAAGRKSLYYHYYEYAEHSVMPHFGVKNSRYKLIRFYGPQDFWELYDLQKDPHEVKNLYGKKGYDQVTAVLKTDLAASAKAYQDDEVLTILASKK